MQTLTEKILAIRPPNGIFNKTVVDNLFPSISEGARKALIFKAIDKNEIIQLKPGLYLQSKYLESSPHPFVVAALLHSPSYISMESALRHHGLIPEAVYQVRSVTHSRSRTFKTAIGYFQYIRIPCKDFRAGVKSIKVDKTNWAFVASPLRAIADLIYLHKKEVMNKDAVGFLTESMRIDSDDLKEVFSDNFKEVYDTFNSLCVKNALLSAKKELEK
ncbi:MAG: hypothetical protein JNL74_10220 [Fibrobacteres bacterium]|nr:hypothetical protein [Fibrobacterota bacterium]